MRVRGWSKFQHYKDRRPPWIKLHRDLLDNFDYAALSAPAGRALPLIWILASEDDGGLPTTEEVAFRLRIEDGAAVAILTELEAFGFIEDGMADQRPEWAPRHVSATIKAAVWKRYGGRCAACRGAENIEFDHIVPISRGGTGDETNIQLLCRPCNRKKRNKLTSAEQTATGKTGAAEQAATPLRSNLRQTAVPLRSLETEREGEKETEEKKDLRETAAPESPTTTTATEDGNGARSETSGDDAPGDLAAGLEVLDTATQPPYRGHGGAMRGRRNDASRVVEEPSRSVETPLRVRDMLVDAPSEPEIEDPTPDLDGEPEPAVPAVEPEPPAPDLPEEPDIAHNGSSSNRGTARVLRALAWSGDCLREREPSAAEVREIARAVGVEGNRLPSGHGELVVWSRVWRLAGGDGPGDDLVADYATWQKRQLDGDVMEPTMPPEPVQTVVAEAIEPSNGRHGRVDPAIMTPRPKAAKGRGSGKSPETWLTPFGVSWSERLGKASKFPFGQGAKLLRPLVEELGHAEAALRFRRYLAATEPEFCSVKRFAETAGRYEAQGLRI